jgi:hypothetical protein
MFAFAGLKCPSGFSKELRDLQFGSVPLTAHPLPMHLTVLTGNMRLASKLESSVNGKLHPHSLVSAWLSQLVTGIWYLF